MKITPLNPDSQKTAASSPNEPPKQETFTKNEILGSCNKPSAMPYQASLPGVDTKSFAMGFHYGWEAFRQAVVALQKPSEPKPSEPKPPS